MTDNPFLKRGAPLPEDERARRFTSNDEILTAFLDHVHRVQSTSTLENSRTQLRKFMDYWDGWLLLDVPRRELTRYIEKFEATCTHFRRGGLRPRNQAERPNRCNAGRQPMDCTNCPLYQAMKAVTSESHFNRVAALFDWLLDKDQIKHNEWDIVMRRWRESNQRRLKKEVSARRYAKRFLEKAEVIRLIERSTSWTWKITALLGVKYFLRAGEVARLKATPRYLDPELNWIMVPMADRNDGKRIIEMRYPIDNETRRYLRAYLRWRNAKLRRCGRDPEAVEQLVIGKNGRPVKDDRKAGVNVTRGLRRMAEAANLEDPETVTSHCLRRFASDQAQENGVHGNDLKLVRGDWLEAEATGFYVDVSRLAALHAKACPPLGVCAPPDDLPMEGKREGFAHQLAAGDAVAAAS